MGKGTSRLRVIISHRHQLKLPTCPLVKWLCQLSQSVNPPLFLVFLKDPWTSSCALLGTENSGRWTKALPTGTHGAIASPRRLSSKFRSLHAYWGFQLQPEAHSLGNWSLGILLSVPVNLNHQWLQKTLKGSPSPPFIYVPPVPKDSFPPFLLHQFFLKFKALKT